MVGSALLLNPTLSPPILSLVLKIPAVSVTQVPSQDYLCLLGGGSLSLQMSVFVAAEAVLSPRGFHPLLSVCV